MHYLSQIAPSCLKFTFLTKLHHLFTNSTYYQIAPSLYKCKMKCKGKLHHPVSNLNSWQHYTILTQILHTFKFHHLNLNATLCLNSPSRLKWPIYITFPPRFKPSHDSSDEKKVISKLLISLLDLMIHEQNNKIVETFNYRLQKNKETCPIWDSNRFCCLQKQY